MAPFLVGGIQRLTTATPDALTITNPTGPTTNIDSAGGGGSSSPAFDLSLSFGHGTPGTDDILPGDAETPDPWWLSPTLFSQLSQLNQVREWPAGQNLSHLAIDMFIDAANLVGGNMVLAITVDGVSTGITVAIPEGVTTGVLVTGALDYLVASTSNVGVSATPGAGWESGTARIEVKVRGTGQTGVLPPPAGADWLMDAALGITVDGSDFVTLIEDQSGSGNDVSPFVPAAANPLFVADTGNGFPGVRFPDYTAAAPLQCPMFNAGMNIVYPSTICTVIKYNSANGGTFWDPRLSINTGFGMHAESGQQWTQPFAVTTTPVRNYNGLYVVIVENVAADGLSMRTQVNGIDIPQAGTPSPLSGGNGFAFGGWINNAGDSWGRCAGGDILTQSHYPASLSSQEMLQYYLAMKAKYGL